MCSESFLADSGVDSLLLVIGRVDVEQGNVEATANVLRDLVLTDDSIRRFRERVEVRCEGYDEDPRELWEIPEVRSFVSRLDDEFPYWMYFLSRHGMGLFWIVRCFQLPYLTPEAELTVNGPRLAGLLERRWFPALNALCERIGLSEDDNRQLTESFLEYLDDGPWKRKA